MAALIPLAALLVLGFPGISTASGSAPLPPKCAAGQAVPGAGGACTDGRTDGPGRTYDVGNSGDAADTVPPASLMPDSLFNGDVEAWPVARHSAAIVAQLDHDWRLNYGSVGVNSRPVVFVPADEPKVPLVVQHGCRSFLADTGLSAPIPPWAPTGGRTDRILTVYQPSTNSLWELWQAHRVTVPNNGGDGKGRAAGAGWSACSAGKASLSTFSGVFPASFGETATGISNLATEVTEADVLSGSINHAIGLQVVDCTTFIYPADRGDCNYDPGTPAEGQWFRFPASVDCADYDSTSFENEVCVAGQRNGFVIVDQGGSVGIEADYATGTWTDEGNPVPVGSWRRGANGKCCIFAGGGAPLEQSFKSSPDDYEQEYQVVAALPWDKLQVITPPHV